MFSFQGTVRITGLSLFLQNVETDAPTFTIQLDIRHVAVVQQGDACFGENLLGGGVITDAENDPGVFACLGNESIDIFHVDAGLGEDGEQGGESAGLIIGAGGDDIGNGADGSAFTQRKGSAGIISGSAACGRVR